MAIRTYHDFIIFTDDVEKDQNGKVRSFSVRVFSSPVGEGERKETVTIPADPDLVQWSRHLEGRRLDRDVGQQMELGARLADLLLPSEPKYTRGFFQRSLAWLHDDEGLRLRLRLEKELVALPWEYMYIQDTDGERTPSGFLALDPRISIVRHEAIAIPAEWFDPAEKRRVLVVMATPQPYTDYPPLKNLPTEQKLIKQALSQVKGIDVEFRPPYDGIGEGHMPGATVDDVRTALLQSADIFHFSGHGEFVKSMGPVVGTIEGEGAIILADEHNRAHSLPGDRLAEMIRRRGIRLVILGCCKGAKRDIFQKWSSVAASLLKCEIPSVVAMQFTIQDDLATAFMGAFYQALVAGLTIDEAVALGRAAIRDKALGERTHVRDWGAPVLYLRVPGGRIFDPVTDKEASQEAERKSNQRFRLHQAWWEWMAHGVTPSADQLQHLAEASETLELSPVQILLLLRSAVAIDASVTPWLARLREQGVDLVTELDSTGDGGAPAEVSTLAEEGDVLGLDNVPSGCPQDVGAVAWAAASHPDVTARQTAALALTALPAVPDEGLERLDRALRGVAPPWKRFARKAELRGTLADGDPQIERRNAGLPPWDRGGIWAWRFRRRARRERDRIRALMFGAAVGAGVALGALRGLLGIPAGPLAMTRFAINLFWGALLGAVIGLGVGLAEPMLVGRRERPAGDAPPFWRAPFHPDRRADLLALLLGTLFFGVMHLLVGWFNGLNLSERALILVTGTLAGFGVNLALYAQPKAGRGQSTIEWLLRMAAAAVPAVLAQWVIIAAGHDWAATAITRTGAHIRDNFGRYEKIYRLINEKQNVFSYLDAALVGILLTVGITIGWQIALKRQGKDGATSEQSRTESAGQRR